jgi:hypothetical protein
MNAEHIDDRDGPRRVDEQVIDQLSETSENEPEVSLRIM